MSNPFSNARIVGDNVDAESYMRQSVQRGDPQFVISRSELMLFASCPQRWIRGYTFKDTDATEFGSLIDCLLTSPETFSKRYVERPATYPAGKKHSQVVSGEISEGDPVPWSSAARWCKDWAKQQGEKEPVSAEDMADARAAVKRFAEDKEINDLLASSKRQVMVVAEYHDRETELVIPTKCLIDLVPDKDSRFGKELADLKTCRSAAHDTWEKELDRHNYDAQGAMNIDHYVAATGEDRCSFLHALMENVFPFEPGKRNMSQEFIELGRAKYVRALKRYCKCLKENKWPGFDEGWTLVQVGPWHSQLRS